MSPAKSRRITPMAAWAPAGARCASVRETARSWSSGSASRKPHGVVFCRVRDASFEERIVTFAAFAAFPAVPHLRSLDHWLHAGHRQFERNTQRRTAADHLRFLH